MECIIKYDYEKQLEKCKKKMKAKERKDDVGEDAMDLAVKYSGRGKEAKKGGGTDEDIAVEMRMKPAAVSKVMRQYIRCRLAEGGL